MSTSTLNKLYSVVTSSLCTRCGACAGICPRQVIEPDIDGFPHWQSDDNACTDCGLCFDICPGRAFDFPYFYKRWLNADFDPAQPHGRFLRAFLGHVTDPELRSKTTSGGIASAIPLFLLKTSRIQGAFAVRSDPALPWRPQAFIARTEADIDASAYSKYPACSMNHLWKEIRNDTGPFLFTGIPCHLHGLHKLIERQPHIANRVAVIVGLLCHSCLDPNAIRDMLAYYHVAASDLIRVIYRYGKLPGFVRAELRDGTQVALPYPTQPLEAYRPNAKECLTFFFKLYSPLRCRMCCDATAECSDISLGDPWIHGWQGRPELKNGMSFILARTPRGLALLEEMAHESVIKLYPMDESEARIAQLPMIRGKRRRCFWTIEQRNRCNKPVPEYGFTRRVDKNERLKAALHAATYFAAESQKLRRLLCGLLLSKPGRWIVGATFFRRRVLQDFWERCKARLRT